MKLKIIFLSFVIIALASCENNKKTAITVTNNLNISRAFETVEISLNKIKETSNFNHFSILDENGELQTSQEVDSDTNGIVDILLFQPKLKAKETKKYFVVKHIEKDVRDTICYSRFVPERTDDYAWENDRVAFRIFGPIAQKMIEENIEGGTLSSGVDCWLKRVNYPIINKWYKKETEGAGSYHEDTGEGLDNFHVGASRGCGGIAIKKDNTFYVSKNFTNYKTLINGPIRTSFYIEYEDWNAKGKLIKESRVITLDRGNNLSKFEIKIKGSDEIYAGLTLHKKNGIVTDNSENTWVSYWEPHGDSELGTAIVTLPESFIDFEKHESNEKDLSNVYIHLKLNSNKAVYYAGFGWKKSNQFKNIEEWVNYLNNFSKRLQSPLKITFM